jgi:hypothetical protein
VQKQVALSIDTASWTNSSAAYKHPYPTNFPSSGGVTTVDFYASLLQLGMLTVPWRGAACSLAAYWAYVRYCAAIDLTNPVLRLVEEWSDLDSHQKTILSDDWGVGFTTHWLISRLGFQAWCDGRYFIDRLAGLGIATVNRQPKKRGPYKCPDYIFEDDQGRFHIVECKGNQQGNSYLESQMSDGIAQKLTIIFSDEQNQVGQRLVAGFFAAENSSSEPSTLAFADPEPRGLIVQIRDDVDPDLLRDAVRRADLARQFQLLGDNSIATELLAMPETKLGHQASRRHNLENLLRNLVVKLEGTFDDDWLARSVNFPLVYDISGNMRFRSVTVSHAIRKSFIQRLTAYDPSKLTLNEQFPESDSLRLGWKSIEHDYSASLFRGTALLSQLSLS